MQLLIVAMIVTREFHAVKPSNRVQQNPLSRSMQEEQYSRAIMLCYQSAVLAFPPSYKIKAII